MDPDLPPEIPPLDAAQFERLAASQEARDVVRLIEAGRAARKVTSEPGLTYTAGAQPQAVTELENAMAALRKIVAAEMGISPEALLAGQFREDTRTPL
jgi:hypothetical protein